MLPMIDEFSKETIHKKSSSVVPKRKLSQNKFLTRQVPLWTVENVASWVKQIGFEKHEEAFIDSVVDGDLLLQLDENNIKNDLGIRNGIHRKRFLRELNALKQNADYSHKDSSNVCGFLGSIGKEFVGYTYGILNSGLSLDFMQRLSEEDIKDMLKEAGVESSIHRRKILETISSLDSPEFISNSVDVFVSFPRFSRTATELASLIKMHLQLRGLSVYDSPLETTDAQDYIRQAKNFLVVLSGQESFSNIIGDLNCKNLLHKELVTAIQSGCNIIPVVDHDFLFPDPEVLPEDIRAICYYNGVKWVYDYQDACVDKIERFVRGESIRIDSGRSSPVRSPKNNRRFRSRTNSIDSAIGAQ